jgi:hypothetical protein
VACGRNADQGRPPAGSGAPPEVKVFSGISGAPLQDYYAFDPSFLVGTFVAASDIDGDGRADVIVGVFVGQELAATIR